MDRHQRKALRRKMSRLGVEQSTVSPPDTHAKTRANPDRFYTLAFGILSVLFFLIQANGVSPNWWISGLIYASCAIAAVWTMLRHAIPDRTRKFQYRIGAVVFLAIGLFGVTGTYKEFQKEHEPNKTDETLQLVKKLDAQQKFLEEFPMGYAIFDVDTLSGAVDPEQAQQGTEKYVLDFRRIAILKNDATGIDIQLPDVLKDGKPVLTNAKIGGDRVTMFTYGAGYTFGDQGKMVMATGRVLSIKGNRVRWIFGMREIHVNQ